MAGQDDHLQRHDAAALAAVEAQGQGRFGLALALFEESLDHAQALENRRKIHAAKINLSSCWLSLGDWANARAGLAEIILETEEPRLASAAAARLAEALMREGRLEKAAHYLRLSVHHAREAADPARELAALRLQGTLAVIEGRNGDGVERYTEALALHERLGKDSLVSRAALLDRLGYAQVLAGSVLDGVRTLRLALRAARAAQDVHEQAEAHCDLGFAFMLAERRAASERHALKSLALATAEGYTSLLKSSTYVLMELSLRSGRDADFDRWFQRLQDLLPDMKLSPEFFRIFDISDVINLKEF